MGLDCWLRVVFQQHPFACIKIGGCAGDYAGRSSAGLFPLHKEILNLIKIFETVKFPRAIGRFINQQAAAVGAPHVSGWRSSQTTANALCFVAQLTLSDLIGGCQVKRGYGIRDCGATCVFSPKFFTDIGSASGTCACFGLTQGPQDIIGIARPAVMLKPRQV